MRGAVAFDLRVTAAKSDVHGRMGATVPSASWRLIWALAALKEAVTEKIAIDGFYDDVFPASEADLQVLHDFPYDEAHTKKSLGLKGFVRGATGEELKRQIYLEPSLSVCGLEAGEVHNGVRGIVPHTRMRASVSISSLTRIPPISKPNYARICTDRALTT